VAEPAAAPSHVALVTGAGRGIGRAIALGLAERGLDIAMIGRSPDTLESTATLCRERGVATAVAVADVTDSAAVTASVQAVSDRLGPCDLLVNNAGRVDAVETGFAAAPIEDVVDVVEVNLLGVMRVTHAVLPSMLQAGRGRILNVNSGFAFRRDSFDTGYTLSKAALARFTDLLAHQVADAGVVVLDVSPGLLRTDMTESMPVWANRDDVPWGDPDDMVRVVAAFARGDLDAISGRFVHAAKDDLDRLVRVLPDDRDARTLGLRPFGDDDPLG
jgi:NAD(P)-dependent dehydrogenase (short-subunit alcohol dehydrogenase family)